MRLPLSDGMDLWTGPLVECGFVPIRIWRAIWASTWTPFVFCCFQKKCTNFGSLVLQAWWDGTGLQYEHLSCWAKCHSFHGSHSRLSNYYSLLVPNTIRSSKIYIGNLLIENRLETYPIGNDHKCMLTRRHTSWSFLPSQKPDLFHFPWQRKLLRWCQLCE